MLAAEPEAKETGKGQEERRFLKMKDLANAPGAGGWEE